MAAIKNAPNGEKLVLSGNEKFAIDDSVDNIATPDKYAKASAIFAGATFQTVYNNSPAAPQVTTTTALGGFFVKRGSLADTDTVWGIKNGAGANVYEVTGQGFIKSGSTFEHWVNGVKAFEIDASQKTRFYNNISFNTPNAKIYSNSGTSYIQLGADSVFSAQSVLYLIATNSYIFRMGDVSKFLVNKYGTVHTPSAYLNINEDIPKTFNVASDISAQLTGHITDPTYDGFFLNVNVAGRTSTGRATFIHLQKNGIDAFRVDIDGKILMANLPISAAGLVAGEIWNNAGVINIV